MDKELNYFSLILNTGEQEHEGGGGSTAERGSDMDAC